MTSYEEVRKRFLDDAQTRSEIYQEMKTRLSYHTVRKYIYTVMKELDEGQLEELAAKRRARTTPKRSRAFVDRKSISPIHVRIGAKLNNFRSRSSEDPAEFVSRTRFANRFALRAMEQGLHDFTLSELQEIAGLIGTDLDGLLSPPIASVR